METPAANAPVTDGPAGRTRPPHRVYIVEDHPIVREAYVALFDAEDDLHVVGSSGSAEAAILDLNGFESDIAVVDVGLLDPGARMNGIHLTGQLHRLRPRLRVLVVSAHDETVYAEQALKAGARGYLMKHEASENLVAAVRLVLLGGVALSGRMRKRLPEALFAPLPPL